ncbi:hypothetical protein BG262_05480 [Floricoccus penangensis]|uniref:Uncharacterized protein n=1 Tax=Floricoccus penangensis TaxID=1859475 RepID=A0A9Q5JGI0_9LACT|nr:SPJ_0845 family protein [Floricoccus penangensis]OFI46467.1 hypothetical protein BG262_05480 [Floricoccus penangensis]
MGLTYKKRDDLEKVLGEFATFPDDFLNTKTDKVVEAQKDANIQVKTEQKPDADDKKDLNTNA